MLSLNSSDAPVSSLGAERFSTEMSANTSDSSKPMNTSRFPFAFPASYDTSKIIIVECDPTYSPYVNEDVLLAMMAFPEVNEISFIGSMSLNYVIAVAFKTLAAAEKFFQRRQILVKERPAILAKIDSGETAIQLNWLPPDIPDDLVRQVFEPYGQVNRIVKLKTSIGPIKEIDTTSRVVVLRRRPGIELTNIPYLVHIAGFRVPVSIRNRPPMCFRCKQIGHSRHNCTAQRVKCGSCSRYGHTAAECRSPTFASVLRTDDFPALTEITGSSSTISGLQNNSTPQNKGEQTANIEANSDSDQMEQEDIPNDPLEIAEKLPTDHAENASVTSESDSNLIPGQPITKILPGVSSNSLLLHTSGNITSTSSACPLSKNDNSIVSPKRRRKTKPSRRTEKHAQNPVQLKPLNQLSISLESTDENESFILPDKSPILTDQNRYEVLDDEEMF